tara:strand:+ start:215 stop:1591 length:1377 start_codon:yes stop_codon:yes gene_type:complete
MASGTIVYGISQQPHGKFVSCQRPIVIQVKVTGATVPAFFRGILWIEQTTNSNNFVETGVQMNGYSDTDNGIYSFNVAEYCRQYFVDEEGFYTQNWCSNLDKMTGRGFRLEVFPVKYTENGGLEPDPDENKYTNDFIAVPTNTSVDESNSTANDYIRVDKYVCNGGNSSQVPWTSSAFNRFTTNMPPYNVMDVSQGFYFFLPLMHRGVGNRVGDMQVTNGAGVMLSIACLSSSYTLHCSLHIHPIILDFWLSLQAGVVVNHLTNATGGLTGNKMGIQIKYDNATTGAFVRSGPIQHYKLIDSSLECSDNNGTNFIFRNMLGNFDFFRATGTETKELTMSGMEFDRHTAFNRADTENFGVIRGQHNTTNLWGKRTEMITVFSQPLTRAQVKWIEEMIMSPQVWITKKIEDYVNAKGYGDMGLIAINIIKGSYKLYSTDKNRSYIEFKYKFSESTLTQKM